MYRKLGLRVALCLAVFIVQLSYALPLHGFEIVTPMPGAVYHPGDKVTFRVAAGADETMRDVFLESLHMSYGDIVTTPPFEINFVIPKEYTGKDMLLADATMVDGRAVKSSVEINVVLPAGVVVKSISAAPTFILLKKLPPGSDANDIRIAETESIGVGGMYSDNVERNITASTDGTTYSSTNEQIVTVNAEGDVTAQGVGFSIITVKNGPHTAEVKVKVVPYRE